MKPNVVVGAGVIGLLSAYEIRRRGGEVVLIDKGEPGQGCSRANTGWVVPSFSAPLPGPGLLATTLRWMLRSDSPLYIRPTAVPSISKWLMQFWRHCNEQDHAAGLAAVASLNRNTFARFDAIKADGVQFEMHDSGLLCAFSTQAAYDGTMATLQAIDDRIGLQMCELKGASLMAKEHNLTTDLVGAIYLPTERHVRPETLNAGLVDWLDRAGVEVRSGVEMTGVSRDGRTVKAVQTTDGPIEAATVLLATGAWSGRLARELGVRLPMQAGKGYTITVKSPEMELDGPVYLPEKKIVVSPYQGAVRVGGTMELSGFTADLDPRRLAAIRRGVERFLPGIFVGGEQTEWVGMRPLAPDGLPVIGRAPGYDNLYLATAHAMLGVTLGPTTAVAAADLVLTGHTDAPVAPFDPARFAGAGHG
ncbi:MAG: FAD-dependent oxidoreductase [Acidobacteriota bacterium]|jgi:D-amino-acid dehydrogenase